MPSGSFAFAEPFIHLLSGEIDIGSVREDGDDLREAEFRNGAELVQPFEPAQGVFDGEGDQPLDFFGRQLGSDGIDLDLHRRRVGEGIERQPYGRADPDDDQEPGEQQHDEAIFQAEINEGVEHWAAPGKAVRSVAATGPDGAFHDFRLQQERPGGDDLLTGLESPDHFQGVGTAERFGVNPLWPIHAPGCGRKTMSAFSYRWTALLEIMTALCRSPT